MKLAYSPASPYVRKVTACAIARGIDEQDRALEGGHDRSGAAGVQPVVQGADPDHRRRRHALRQPGDLRISRQHRQRAQAVPAGRPRALEGALPGGAGRRHPGRDPAAPPRDRPAAGRRPQGLHRAAAGQGEARARRAREGRRLARRCSTTIGEITIGCALGYLDFRYANEPWRPGHPKLEAWYAKVAKLPPLAETMPVG